MELVFWPGWLAGLFIGLLLLTQFVLTAQPLGCSAGYGNVCSRISRFSVFKDSRLFGGLNHWRVYFMGGIFIGGFLGTIGPDGIAFQLTADMGALYNSILPENIYLKGLVLMGGGVLMGVGSRMAGGCTSGHTISGISLLNPPSLLASALFFVGGTIMVQGLFFFLA